MRSRSGVTLFNIKDHQLLQSISTKRESQDQIQPISITDIDKINPDYQTCPISERPGFNASTKTDTEFPQTFQTSRVQLKKEDSSNFNSPSLTAVQAINQKLKLFDSFDINQIQDDSQYSSQRTQIRAVAQTRKLTSGQQQEKQFLDKSIDNSLIKTELESSFLRDSNFLLNKIRPSSSQKNVERKTTYLKSQSKEKFIGRPRTRLNTNMYYYPPMQSIKVEVEELQFQNLKKPIQSLISTVLFKMLEGTFSRKLKSLTTPQIQLIKDRSYHIVNDEKTNTSNILKCLQLLSCNIFSSTQQIKQTLKKLIHKIPMIQPTNQFNICLNIIQMTSLISLFFLYSFSIFFFYSGNYYTIGIEYFSIFLSLIDIASKFFVGIYNKGEIVLDRLFICKNYLKSIFFIDILSLLSVLLSAIRITENYYINTGIQLIFFIRILSTKYVFSRMDHIIHIIGKANYLYQLFKLVFKLVLLCHVISVFFHITAVFEQNYFESKDTWLDTLGINDSLWYEKYVFAFFQSFNTIMLNTNSNLNALESLFTIIVMCSTIGTFAYIMSSIGDILESENRKKREFKSDLETINEYMRKKNLKKEIQSKVCNFLEYLYEEKGDIKNNKDAIHVLKRLPLNLREDIQQDINQKVVESFTSICNTFSDKIKKRTVQIIEEECYLPNEIIFKQGSFNNQALYLVQKGKVLLENVKNKGDSVTFSVQEKNGIFGENNFFTGQAFDYQARSGDFTTLYKIPRKEFIEILQSSNDDFEQFCVTRDSILLQNNSPFLTISCKICKSKYHSENNCDKVHFTVNSSFVIKKFLYEEPAERRNQNRKMRLRMNATHFVNQMREVCEKITSNEEYIPLLEVIIQDNLPLYDHSHSSSDGEEGSDEDYKDEDDNSNYQYDDKTQSHRITQNNLSNKIIEEGEEYEQSPKYSPKQKRTSIMNDDFSLSYVQNNTQNSPRLSYQNMSNTSCQINYNNVSNFSQVKSIYQNKSNPNIPSVSSSSSLPHIISSLNKIQNFQRNLQNTEELNKSQTINSQNSSQSPIKCSRVFADNEPVFEQQKSTFCRRQQQKKKCVIIPKSFSKQYSKHLTEQLTNQSAQNKSRVYSIEGEQQQQFAVYQQLSKMNTMIERQMSFVEPSIKINMQSNSQNEASNRQLQQNEQQMNEFKQHLMLFDQIKQNLMDFQKQLPIDHVIFSNEFEKMRKYRIYFPLGNYTYVINNINKNQRIQIKSTRKRTHVKQWTFMNKLNSEQD